MAYWFHRNPLKATAPVTFELRGVSTTEQSRKIFSTLRICRNRLLEYMMDPNHEVTAIEDTLAEYSSLIQGLYTPFDENEQTNKLRDLVRFRWTNTLLGNKATEIYDAIYDHASMLINVALWYTKHGAKLAAKDEPSMDEAKEVHRCLRTAAGLLTFVKTELVPRLEDSPENGTDLDSRVLEAYINQCTGEAQEVTMARAIELQHKSSLIAALAYETGQLFKRADDALASLDAKMVAKWRGYLLFKSEFYMSYAYSYHGNMLLAEDKCGEAIKCLQESVKMYEKASQLSVDYGTSKGPGTSAKPHNHIFFRKLGPHVKRTLEKCDRENGMIYHQKVPYDPPKLDLKPTFGLAAPVDYTAPAMGTLWSVDVYKKMDTAKIVKADPKKDKEKEKETETLPTVKEKEYPMSDKDPNNKSGCVLS